MKRQIVIIDEEKCDGCGLCIPDCHEGALQLIDGKARLVSDLFCDGLGACLGSCPQGAIRLEEREAEPYDERRVMETIVPKGKNTILAHLEHLQEHNEEGLLRQALDYLEEHRIDLGIPFPLHREVSQAAACGCSGSLPLDFRADPDYDTSGDSGAGIPSALRQWPVQLHLLNPQAACFRDADLLLASDCSAFTMGGFHQRFMKGKAIAIACPKLDQGKESYVEKLASMICDAGVRSVTVVMMEVPCCGGLAQLAFMAMQRAGMNIPLRQVILSIKGEILRDTGTA